MLSDPECLDFDLIHIMFPLFLPGWDGSLPVADLAIFTEDDLGPVFRVGVGALAGDGLGTVFGVGALAGGGLGTVFGVGALAGDCLGTVFGVGALTRDGLGLVGLEGEEELGDPASVTSDKRPPSCSFLFILIDLYFGSDIF